LQLALPNYCLPLSKQAFPNLLKTEKLDNKNIPVPRAALECRENVLRISAWRIKQGHLPLWPQAAQSQQLQGLQGIRPFMSGSKQTDLLPTCCLRTAAQGYAGQQAGSL